MNILDQIIAYVNPRKALERQLAREVLQERAYAGASLGRDKWIPKRSGASANADHAIDARMLRARARALVQNVPNMARALNGMVSNTIGTGIIPRSLAPNAVRVDDLWDEWAKVCDADATKHTFGGFVAAAYRASKQDGEVLIRLRPRRADDGLPVPLQLQLLEIDWLDSSKTGTNNGNAIINGIEYNPLGQVVAYWLFDQRPGEHFAIGKGAASSKPVPASSIIHYYNPDRPGQGRGIPMFAPVISRVRDFQNYEDAEAARKNLESRLGVIASGDSSNTLLGAAEKDPTAKARAVQNNSMGTLRGGEIVRIPADMNVTVVEPKAAPGYVEYCKYRQHDIASGLGVTYEMMTGDYSEVNFSSARMARLEFICTVESERWLHVIPRLCDRIRAAWYDAAILAGKLPETQSRKDDWSTPKWAYVNPVQDVKADVDEIQNGLSSFSEKLRMRGYKPEQVFAELKTDLERLKEDGILDVLLLLKKGRTLDEGTPSQK